MFEQQNEQMFIPNKTDRSTPNFNPIEFVGRGSETQLQVGENVNNITWGEKG